MLVRALRYTLYPLILAGATGAGMVLLERTEPEVAIGAIGLGCIVIIALLERVHAYVPAYNRSHGDVGTDLLHNAVSGIAIPELTKVAGFGALYAASAALSEWLGVSLWPARWPLLGQLALALIVAELPSYWFHRIQHTSELWWRIHATHHSVPRLYWLNAGRFHPLDALLSYAILMGPLVLFGAPERTIALFTIFVTAHGLLQHSNIDLAHGPLSWIFSTAELHRWHHAPTPPEGNHNYGAVLAIWDVVFGTRYLPADRHPPEAIGIASMPRFPAGYFDQLASPFTWRALGGQDPQA